VYLLISAVGKYWRLNYRYASKQKTLALGVYPAVPLAAARETRDRARDLLVAGNDPGVEKQEAEKQAKRAAGWLFEVVAREWLATSAGTRGEETQQRDVSWLADAGAGHHRLDAPCACLHRQGVRAYDGQGAR
jgi:hypothetical protein